MYQMCQVGKVHTAVYDYIAIYSKPSLERVHNIKQPQKGIC